MTLKIKYLTLVQLLFFVCCKPLPVSAQAPATNLTHLAWTDLLQKHVKNGVVNYKNFQKDSTALNAYCTLLARQQPTKTWQREASFAYWINAYNAFTIRTILRHYPVKSIKDIPNVWTKKDIVLGDKKYSLDEIENQILRPKYRDARVHAAINCASKSCPPLRNEAFVAEKLDAQLNEQAAAFVNSNFHNTITEKKWTLSPIFLWFIFDFGTIKTFVRTHYQGEAMRSKNPIIGYKTYDWGLNE